MKKMLVLLGLVVGMSTAYATDSVEEPVFAPVKPSESATKAGINVRTIGEVIGVNDDSLIITPTGNPEGNELLFDFNKMAPGQTKSIPYKGFIVERNNNAPIGGTVTVSLANRYDNGGNLANNDGRYTVGVPVGSTENEENVEITYILDAPTQTETSATKYEGYLAASATVEDGIEAVGQFGDDSLEVQVVVTGYTAPTN